MLATSDVPAGVVNVLTGSLAELAPVAAAHMDVNAIDLTGVAPAGRADLGAPAAANLKRVLGGDESIQRCRGTRRLLSALEIKTVWHPVGI